MVRPKIRLKVLCIVALLFCAAGSGRAGGNPRLIISEFRLGGPSGATDEYIEVFNWSGSPHTVAAASGIGYGIAASDGITRCTILNGTVIPAGGHFLCVNSGGYSLGSYPAGYGTTAAGDASYTHDIPDNAGIAIFNNNIGGVSYSLANRVDAVGSALESNPLYREGSGYSPVSVAGPRESAWVRTTYGSCATGICTPWAALPWTSDRIDSDDNARDFYYTDTSAATRLGAPGPQNLVAPVLTHGGDSLEPSRVSGCSSSDMPPNRIRDLEPGPNAPLGTLDLRVKWTNSSSIAITRLRFRVVDLTTAPAAGSSRADVRVISGGPKTFIVDNYPCGPSDGIDVAVGTTLEQPATQPDGGGFNSSLSVPAGGPSVLPAHGSINVRVRLGVVRNGFVRFCMVPETTPIVFGAHPWCYVGSTEALTDLPAPDDYDLDRFADMATYDPATLRWTIRQSSGGFATEQVVTLGLPDDSHESAVPVPGDYDGDGRIDPAIYRRSSGTWLVAKSRFNSSFVYTYRHGGPEWTPVPGDYDGDGTTDFAVSSPTRRLWRFWPSSSPSEEMVERSFAAVGWTPIGGQDFDGDGLCDMVTYNENTGRWWSRSSSSDFTSTTSQFWGGRGFTLVPGDYDGDRRADYAVYQRASGVWWVLLSGVGITTPSAPPYSTGFSAGWGGPGFVPVPADYDGDHRTDIAVYQAGATRWRALMSSTDYSTSTPLTIPFGSASARAVSSAVLPASSREIRAGDADGDGISDITVYNTTTGIWSMRQSSNGFMDPPIDLSRGGIGYIAVPGDYDGDGRRDLAYYQPSTGIWVAMRSDSNFMTGYSTTMAHNRVPVAADYDGDGRTDMVGYNPATGQWYGYVSSDNFVTTFNRSFGGVGLTAVPGDYDGDGMGDLGIYHEATGNWAVQTSSTGYVLTIWRAGFGGPGHQPIPADFDGDGLTDIAVYQTETGLWTILRSDTGNTLAFAVPYGGAGYTPVAGDWDGDRRADIGTYYVDGSWSIPLTGAGYRESLSRMLGGAGRVPLPPFR